MKLKKILLIILISIFCFMPLVYAKDAVVLKSITAVESTNEVILNETESIDVVFNALNESATYEVVLKNNTEDTLYVNDLNISNKSEEFLNIVIDEKSLNKEIDSNKEEKVKIIMKTIKKEGVGRNFTDDVELKFVLDEKISNPNTDSNRLGIILLVVVLIISLILVFVKFNNRNSKIMAIFICMLVLGTTSVLAKDEISVSIEGRVSYESQNLLETTGTGVANGTINYDNSKDVWGKYYSQIKNVYVESLINEPNDYVEKFDLTTDDKNRVVGYVVENGDSEVPYDLYVMADGIIYANVDSTGLFSFPKVERIEGIENVDFSNTKIMRGMFIGDEKLELVNGVENIDFTNAEDTSYMFYMTYALNIDEEAFNVAEVKTKNNMFVQYLYDLIEKKAFTETLQNYPKKYTGEGSSNYIKNVYYYYGDVSDNNIIFADLCWKIVRTTNVGGVKLIYNGTVDSSNKCIGTTSYIGSVRYNDVETISGAESYLFDDGTNSVAKTLIDNWYEVNIEDYSDYLEDITWCQDRKFSSLDNNKFKYFSTINRVAIGSKNPSLECSQESDKLSVANGKLNYPVALLTADEIYMAGNLWANASSTYLKTDYEWWSMSPSSLAKQYNNAARVFVVKKDGSLNDLGVGGGTTRKIRPSIALNSKVDYISGDGTTSNPYIVNLKKRYS